MILFSALQTRFREPYHLKDLKKDIVAGILVACIAIPLAMALAIAVHVPPAHGLYTIIVAGSLASLCGGSVYQVTGPTAAFVVILAPIVSRHGIEGLWAAGFLAGILLTVLALSGLGNWIHKIPHQVVVGFSAGVGLVIAILQLESFLGLSLPPTDHIHQKIFYIIQSIHLLKTPELFLGVCTLVLLFTLPRFLPKIPPALLVMPIIATGSLVIHQLFGVSFATIQSKLGAISNSVPVFRFPPELLSFVTIIELIFPAFAIALLGAIETLLSARVADDLTNTKHHSNGELMGCAIANLTSPLFGGIPATGALARTSANIRFGATSPIAGIVHSLTTLLVIVFLASYASYLPIALMSGLLIYVAYHMMDLKTCIEMSRNALMKRTSDLAILGASFFFTVFFDMVVGVGAGVTIALLRFLLKR